jgi:hypothetical protein
VLPGTPFYVQVGKDPAHAVPSELAADIWFDKAGGGSVVEDAIYGASKSQSLTLFCLRSQDTLIEEVIRRPKEEDSTRKERAR